MKINFTKKEYRTLLDMLFLAEWVVDAHEIEPDMKYPQIHELAQKLYSYAKEMGCEELVHYFANGDEYEPSRKYEDETVVFDIIDRHEDMNFWDSLIHRLTERDVYESVNLLEGEKLDSDEFFKLAEPIEAKYISEFEKLGLKRLKINET